MAIHNENLKYLKRLMRYLYHVLQVKKLTSTTETNLNILDNKIDAKTAELLAIIQVRFIAFLKPQE